MKGHLVVVAAPAEEDAAAVDAVSAGEMVLTLVANVNSTGTVAATELLHISVARNMRTRGAAADPTTGEV